MPGNAVVLTKGADPAGAAAGLKTSALRFELLEASAMLRGHTGSQISIPSTVVPQVIDSIEKSFSLPKS